VGLSSQAVLEISQRSLVCTSAFPALRRLRQENCEFEANLGYIMIVRLCLKTKTKKHLESLQGEGESISALFFVAAASLVL
jgi:hypothetical protein